jgi:hypothetical protein
MPRVTPLRVLRLLVTPWLVLLGIWLFMPSPTTPLSGRQARISSTLTSSRTLTTVIPYDDSFRSNGKGGIEEGSSVVVRWYLSYSHKEKGFILRIGDSDDINLSHDLARSNIRTNLTESKRFRPFMSKPYAIRVGAGDTEHPYNMPWFTYADKIMNYEEFHGFHAEIMLTTVVHTPGVIEVWKSGVVDTALKSGSTVHQLRDSYREGMLASFELPPPDHDVRVTSIKVNDVKGDFPSWTYPIRKIIIFPLAPMVGVVSFILLPVAGVLFVVAAVILTVYWLVVCVGWFSAGCPEYRPWRQEFSVKRYVFPHSRGAQEGQVEGNERLDEIDREEKEMALKDEDDHVDLKEPEQAYITSEEKTVAQV